MCIHCKSIWTLTNQFLQHLNCNNAISMQCSQHLHLRAHKVILTLAFNLSVEMNGSAYGEYWERELVSKSPNSVSIMTWLKTKHNSYLLIFISFRAISILDISYSFIYICNIEGMNTNRERGREKPKTTSTMINIIIIVNCKYDE